MGHIRSQAVVDSALWLSDIGLRDADNAEIHGVALKTIRRWRREYQRRGKPRGQGHTSVPCPRCADGQLDDASYAELLGWYLGDGCLTEARRGVYLLTIVNDRRYTMLNAHLMDLLRAVKPGSRPHQRNRPGCVNTSVSWKHWPCLLPQHGPGPKHQRRIVLETWQREIVERCPGDFARGLFHSDGCRTINWTTRIIAGRLRRYEYPRYFFSNESSDILAICGWTLDLLGVQWRLPRANAISVARAASVAILDEHVGPKT
jgi:hypothetical protein